jgi:23S rRNA pseudouridine1911/1915/1917 synthase
MPSQMPSEYHDTLSVSAEASGRRLDQFLVSHLEDVSRSRIQLLLENGDVLVDGKAAKPSLRLRGGETIAVLAAPQPEPLHATAEDIPLDVIYEDDDLAVVNKPAGMMVHAGSGATDDARNRGTLVNALLHHFQSLSTTGGQLRPGIVHRLDKETSGLIVIAKNDSAHHKLASMFAQRRMHKTYIALVHGEVERDSGTVNAPIARDLIRRTRMTTRRLEGARTAISHYRVIRRYHTKFGRFTLLNIRIETGRTHQIRVHMASLGHAVVGDTLYGAPAVLKTQAGSSLGRELTVGKETLQLKRNFLHAAQLEFYHPTSGNALSLTAPLPGELEAFERQIASAAASH